MYSEKKKNFKKKQPRTRIRSQIQAQSPGSPPPTPSLSLSQHTSTRREGQGLKETWATVVEHQVSRMSGVGVGSGHGLGVRHKAGNIPTPWVTDEWEHPSPPTDLREQPLAGGRAHGSVGTLYPVGQGVHTKQEAGAGLWALKREAQARSSSFTIATSGGYA